MKFTKIILIGALAAVYTPPAASQQLPFKPQPTVRVRVTCAGDPGCAADWHVDPRAQWYAPLRVTHRTADRAWLAWTGAATLFTVADTENSLYALRAPGTSEVNPLFGPHPSRGRYYAIMLPSTGLSTYMSWRYKREDDALRAAGFGGHRFAKWWLVQAATVGAHAVGILITISSTGR